MKAKKLGSLDALLAETLELATTLRHAVAEAYDDLAVARGPRDLLRFLGDHGPTTVPHIARARGVSRQHVQTLVNGLSAKDLVELVDNPAHRRSRIVRLTGLGELLLDEVGRREREIWASLDLPVKRRELDAATDVLGRIRGVLGGTAWDKAVRRARP